MQEAVTFLLSIWKIQASDEAPFFCVSSKSPAGKWKDHFLEWPIAKDELKELLEKHEDSNLYFCPNAFVAKRRINGNVRSTNYLWADLDEIDPRDCFKVPQVAWESSPKRYACLWRLSEEIDAETADKVNQATTYACGADRGGWDLSQVLRIPGTRNFKYKNKPKVKLLWNKTNTYRIDDFPDEVRQSSPKTKKKMKAETRRLLEARKATVGMRSEVIWRLENELHEQGFTPEEIFELIKDSVWNKFKGRKDEDRQLRRELDKVREKHVDEEPQVRKSLMPIRLADVEPETVEWLWWPYIPLGKLTLIEGDPGLGKSWLTMALTTHVSTKKRLPGQEIATGGTVLLMSAEDGLADTIRPRLDILGANVSRVYSIDDPVTLDEDGIEDIDEIVEQLKPKLIIVDPLVAYMGGKVDLHKANETREVMARLGKLAQRHHVAVVGVRHLTKGSRDKSIYRGIGSIDLTAAARSVIMVGRNPEEPNEGRVFCHIKCNLAPLGRAQAYTLSANNGKPFHFDGPVDYTAEEVAKADVGAPAGSTELQDCTEWLREQLSTQARKSDDVRRDAEGRGFDRKTLQRARKDLNIEVTADKDGTVWWKLPEE